MAEPTPTPRYFRLLLRMYPRAYLDRYAVEMTAFFQRERAADGGSSLFWVRLTLDHIEAAWAVRSRARREGGEGTLTTLMDDLRTAARALRRAPRFAGFAIVTLALGVGAVTAVFTVVDRVALSPLPYPGSERIVRVGIDARHDPGTLGPLSPALFQALSDRPGPTESIAAARSRGAILTGEDDPERVSLTEVSADLLAFFGASPAAGRLLDARDHAPGAAPVVVLGHGYWVERYGADPGVVGRALRFDDDLYTVVGVLGSEFVPPPEVVEGDRFWVPLPIDPTVRGSFSLAGVARLRPGATLSELDEHADRVTMELYAETERPTFLLGATIRSYHENVVGPVGQDLRRVLSGVFLLLLIACVNVAGLLLTRGADRRHEMDVLFAMGAPRLRLVRTLLMESLLLATLGGAMGAALAWGSVELFRAYAPAGLPRLSEVALDGTGLLFALLVATGTALLFGLLPALRSTVAAGRGMGSVRGATAGRSEGRLRGMLVSAETALAVVLTVGSALLAHDLVRVSTEDPGFRPEGLAAMSLNLAPRYERAEWVGMWEQLLEGVAATPGVTSAAIATQAPWDGSRIASTYRPEGMEDEEPTFMISVSIAGDYERALGTRIIEGQPLDGSAGDGEPVVLVNHALAETFWPGESAVGRLLHSGQEDEETYTIVGVLEDVRTHPGSEVTPHVFHPLADMPWRQMELLARTPTDAAALAPPLRDVVRRLDSELPVTSVRTMDALSSEALASPRFYASLFGGFALIALLLAIVGVYGTTAYATRTRLREAGIRRVLGAKSGQVVRTLVIHSGVAVAVGAAIGLLGAALGSTFLAETLRYVEPRDILTYLAVAAVVVVAGIVSAWLPAAAAGRADPIAALREE